MHHLIRASSCSCLDHVDLISQLDDSLLAVTLGGVLFHIELNVALKRGDANPCLATALKQTLEVGENGGYLLGLRYLVNS